MNTELDALENKIEQVVALVHQLRTENEVLKNQIDRKSTRLNSSH